MEQEVLGGASEWIRRLLIVVALCALAAPTWGPTDAGIAASGETTTATAFVALLAQGNFAAAERYFSPALQAAAPTARLQQIWEALIAQLGSFQRQAGTTQQSAGAAQNVVVHCLFSKDTADLVISFGQDGKIGGFHVANIQPRIQGSYTPPGYVNTASFHERAVTVGNAPWALPGTLTMPGRRGPFPAVVLVAGSGPEDRDETVAGDKPFRDIAWGLASRGIAVLRYDKRTLVYGTRIAALSDFTAQDEFVDDALAAVQILARTASVDRRHIYVLGHSEGAMMAPLIARQDARIAGLIIMAGPTRPLVDVIVGQYVYLQSRGLVSAAQVAAVEQQATAIKALGPADRSHGGLLLGAPPAYWLSIQHYQPAAVAARLTIPLLIMQAARDYQVTLADFAGWKTALRGRPDVTFKLYAGLFHPFIPVPPGSPAGLATPGAYQHPGHVDLRVIGDITAWLRSTGA